MFGSTAALQVLGGTFLLAVLFGAVLARSNFCVMGAVSDWINIGDRRRMRAWLLAMATAILGVTLLQWLGGLDTSATRIPYRSPVFAWSRYLLGGLVFGIGMTLASGCSSRNLVRLGGGNLKSLVVLIAVAVPALLMIRGPLYGWAFHGWMQHLHIDLTRFALTDQGVDTLAGRLLGIRAEHSRTIAGGALAVVLAAFVFASARFRASRWHVIGGLIVGLVVTAAWWLTGGALGQQWIEDALFQNSPPPAVGVQSFSFVSPLAEAARWVLNRGEPALITIGIAAVAGTLLGSFATALVRRQLRLEWFADATDFVRHLTGGALMGIGGVLALGCSIGQGVTGVSTLALGSFIAAACLVLGSALTMKVEYYLMIYENDASFGSALLTSLADLRLLPSALRRHESV